MGPLVGVGQKLLVEPTKLSFRARYRSKTRQPGQAEIDLGHLGRTLWRDPSAPGFPALTALALELLGARCAEALHHAPHLEELLDELCDLTRVGARPAGDAGPARPVDELGTVALGERHRVDDAFDTRDLAV